MTRLNFYAAVAVSLALWLTPAASGAQISSASRIAEPGSELTVYVMTMGPGEFVWERFGHNALWIHDSSRGTDIAYNWGLFSFEQEDFILRFIRGHMDYWMEGIDAEATATHYIRFDRSVWVQELNLTPAQRIELRDFVETNALPGNRTYRYDYFRDNCSTRVRDAIDRVLGGQLRAQTGDQSAATTYRERSREAVGEAPLLFTGIMLGLGRPTDRELTAWEDMFMPLSMMERMRGVTIAGADGEPVPLVRSERQIYASAQLSSEPAEGPSVWIYLLIGAITGGAIAVAARYAGRRDARAVFRLLVILWGGIAGLLGTVLLLLWLATDHTAAHANENLFFFNPLLLVLAVLLPIAAGPSGRGRHLALLTAGIVAALSLLGFVLQALPWFDQSNGELIALALPINLAMAYAAWHYRARKGATAAVAPTGPADPVVPMPA